MGEQYSSRNEKAFPRRNSEIEIINNDKDLFKNTCLALSWIGNLTIRIQFH